MLRKATKRDRPALRESFHTIYELPEFQYLYANGHSVFYDMPPSTSQNYEISVSEDDGLIIGYFFAYVNREYGFVEEVVTINFTGRPSLTFAKDMLKFINNLIDDPQIERAMFHCVESNSPAVSLDDRVIARLNGRLVGTLTNAAVLPDGTKNNVRIYEVLKPDMNEDGLKKKSAKDRS